MNYVEAVDDFKSYPRPLVFLAGGITNCPDWQSEIVRMLSDLDKGTLVNPRRKNFPIHDPHAAEEQITWEFHAIRDANIFSMWFCGGPSDQPICMFELGANIRRDIPVCIGVDPGYRRRQDVCIQTRLISPSAAADIASSLRDHANNIRDWVSFWHE